MQDAIKGVEMFKKTNVPVIGYVSNMSAFICPCCGNKTSISSKSRSFSQQTGVDLLGDIPFDIEIGESSDDGNPLVISKPNSPQVHLINKINQILSIS